MNNDLLTKYNKPVPRYTSYPPANFFSDSFTHNDYLSALKASNDMNPQAISFYFHIPFCKRICYYCGCNHVPMAETTVVENYMKALFQEIDIVSQYLDKKRPVTQVHFGGGTPNSVASNYLTQIVKHLKLHFTFSADAEIAIECHPAYLDENYLNDLLDGGFNRFSIGIQDFNPTVLKGVNRLGATIDIATIISIIKNKNPKAAVNLDFIYGLPYQTVESFCQTINQAVGYKPDRLVTFSYAHVPWVNKNQEILEKRGLPNQETKSAMFREAVKLLTANGYKQVGMDHFVLEHDELNQALNNKTLHRNFQGYCTRSTTGQVYAFGVSGISQLANGYSQNSKSVNDYIQSINKGELPITKGYLLSAKEMALREVITELMCNKSIVWSELAHRFNYTETEFKELIGYDASALTEFKDDGLIDFNDNEVHMTASGDLFVRNVAAAFDPLTKSEGVRFSKPI